MIPYPHSQKNEASTRPLTRKRLTRKGFSDIVLNSIATLALQLKKFSSSLQRSSGNPRVAVLGEIKKLKRKRYFCGSFSLFFVLHFFAISSICMHSHSQHLQTKLSHHHTEVIQSYHIQTIIPKSYQNQSNLETYDMYYNAQIRVFLQSDGFQVEQRGPDDFTLPHLSWL